MQGTIKKFKGNLEKNPWWTGQRRIVKLGDRIAKGGEWILKLGLWHLEVVFWNLQVVLWNLHCETWKSYCETLPGDCETLTPDCETLKRDFETQKSDHETPCWDSESPCRRSSYHVENNRTYQSDLQVPQAEVDTCMPCQSWKSKPYCTHSRSISILVGAGILISSCLQLYTLNIKFKCHEVGICITFSLPLYTFKVNRVGNFDIF